MKTLSKIGWSLGALLVAGQAFADITFYEHDGFQGRSFVAAGDRPVANLRSQGFNDRASSVIVAGARSERWEVCEDGGFQGRCVVLRPGEYPSLTAMGLNDRISSVRSIPAKQRVADNRYAPAPGAPSQIEFFAREDFAGRSYSTGNAVPDLRGNRFDDRTSSIVVTGGTWQVCADPGYAGTCALLRPGRYPTLANFGFENRISSARAVASTAVPPAPPATPAQQIVFFEHEGLRGGALTATAAIADFRGTGLDNRASSVVVASAAWEVCQGTGFTGPCVILRPGTYASLKEMGMNERISSARVYQAPPAPPPVLVGQISLYEADGYQGRNHTSEAAVADMRRVGFDDRASSVVVRGNQAWEVCEDLSFSGRCVLLQPGDYPSLSAMGMNNRITSMRMVATGAQPQRPPVAGDYRRRDDERLFQ
ncbi:MAG: beta/gamma crystallin-related protein, partial [Rubrivivax sp.]|nr:beta/gamma crystallin-related protein [Rubrivivax sp.]